MTLNQKLGVILVFYTVTHTAVAWVMGTETMIVRLAVVFALVACVVKEVRHALTGLAGICGLFAVSGVALLIRLESDWPIYTAVVLYIGISSAFALWLLRTEQINLPTGATD
jgi:type III secretory pathway component EscR